MNGRIFVTPKTNIFCYYEKEDTLVFRQVVVLEWQEQMEYMRPLVVNEEGSITYADRSPGYKGIWLPYEEHIMSSAVGEAAKKMPPEPAPSE